jgi:anti-anti-sigma regulatory factor
VTRRKEEALGSEPEKPYEIEVVDDHRAVVRFTESCHQETRTKQREDELNELVARYDRVAWDLSNTRAMASAWLRWLAKLTEKADKTGKVAAVVGMHNVVRATADVIGLQGSLHEKPSLEEVWQR